MGRREAMSAGIPKVHTYECAKCGRKYVTEEKLRNGMTGYNPYGASLEVHRTEHSIPGLIRNGRLTTVCFRYMTVANFSCSFMLESDTCDSVWLEYLGNTYD